MSNSKLTTEQKQFRKDFRASNPRVLFFSFPQCGVTVAIQETGPNMAEFAVSIASESEVKFRRKVGEYHAANRMDMGITMPVVQYAEMDIVVFNIAATVSGQHPGEML